MSACKKDIQNYLDENNTNPIIARYLFRIEGQLGTAISIGSGTSEETDSDIQVATDGTCIFRGSALAGILGSSFQNGWKDKDRNNLEEKKDLLFGSDKTRRDEQSRLSVYDTKIQNAVITTRDGVALDSNKTAKYGTKHDYQVVDRDCTFVFRMELIVRKNEDEKILLSGMNYLFSFMKSTDFYLGAKSNAGLGRMEPIQEENILVKRFAFDQREKTSPLNELEQWSLFSWYDDSVICEEWNSWNQLKEKDIDLKDIDLKYESPYLRLITELNLNGGLLIRSYTSEGQHFKGLADYYQLTSAGKPIIPGSSWKGAFRNHLEKLLTEIAETPSLPSVLRLNRKGCITYLNDLFGSNEKDKDSGKDAHASLIRFDESTVISDTDHFEKEEGGFLPVTRTKIDRFTGGVVNGALFTSCPWFLGKTELTIHIPKERGDIVGLVLLALRDLSEGVLSVGGETSIGRGVFFCTNTNNIEISEGQLGVCHISDKKEEEYQKNLYAQFLKLTEKQAETEVAHE